MGLLYKQNTSQNEKCHDLLPYRKNEVTAINLLRNTLIITCANEATSESVTVLPVSTFYDPVVPSTENGREGNE